MKYPIEYWIALLIEERDCSDQKHCKSYNKDITKLLVYQEQIKQLQNQIDMLYEEAKKYWDNIC